MGTDALRPDGWLRCGKARPRSNPDTDTDTDTDTETVALIHTQPAALAPLLTHTPNQHPNPAATPNLNQVDAEKLLLSGTDAASFAAAALILKPDEDSPEIDAAALKVLLPCIVAVHSNSPYIAIHCLTLP